jgi:hypothetical protein
LPPPKPGKLKSLNKKQRALVLGRKPQTAKQHLDGESLDFVRSQFSQAIENPGRIREMDVKLKFKS